MTSSLVKLADWTFKFNFAHTETPIKNRIQGIYFHLCILYHFKSPNKAEECYNQHFYINHLDSPIVKILFISISLCTWYTFFSESFKK